MVLHSHTLLRGREEENPLPHPGGIQTHDLLIMRCVLYLCATITAQPTWPLIEFDQWHFRANIPPTLSSSLPLLSLSLLEYLTSLFWGFSCLLVATKTTGNKHKLEMQKEPCCKNRLFGRTDFGSLVLFPRVTSSWVWVLPPTTYVLYWPAQ